jgi:antirestriction protein ArdC
MGAAFLCGVAGIENSTIEQSAAYLKGWLRALASEPRMLVIAAAQAQKAADFILGRAEADVTISEPADMPAAA